MFDENTRVLLAFIVNIAAGLSTCLGGLLIFMNKFVHLANRTSLGIALGMSAGVMIFISLVEIFHESMNKFSEGIGRRGMNESNDHSICEEECQGHSWLFASLCFTIGVLLVYFVDFLLHKISPDLDHEPDVILEELEELKDPSMIRNSIGNPNENENETETENVSSVEKGKSSQKKFSRGSHLDERTKNQLKRTGILTAVAIAMHNLPEGIGTFLTTLTKPRLGISLAIGIALHNIPEGVAVAVPVYFATGSRSKAILWTFLSSLFEPLGGFLSWLIFRKGVGPIFEGSILGIIAGIMVTISFKELIPTAHRYCAKSDRVTLAIFIGIAMMIISLTLLAYAGL